jgi:hypothetical protein
MTAQPNEKNLKAHQEALNEKGTAYNSMDDFWADMGVKRRTKSIKWGKDFTSDEIIKAIHEGRE